MYLLLLSPTFLSSQQTLLAELWQNGQFLMNSYLTRKWKQTLFDKSALVIDPVACGPMPFGSIKVPLIGTNLQEK
jgi:hypothetical protein